MTNAVNIAQSGSNNQTMRNRIINGAMTIDQRNNGAAVAFSSGSALAADRFQGYNQNTGAYTIQQVADAPAGFKYSDKITTTTAGSTGTADWTSFVQHKIEGFNIADLGAGTSSPQPITLSFWVKSSLTGTMPVTFGNDVDRTYATTYTINAANTWEQKTITLTLPTSGTWNSTNGRGLLITWGLGSGSTYTTSTLNSWQNLDGLYFTSGAVAVGGTLNATWQITGVQLEEGTAASPFENRLYGTELQLCQRYFWQLGGLNTGNEGVLFPQPANPPSSSGGMPILFKNPVPMRTAPDVTFNITAGNFSGASTPSGTQWQLIAPTIDTCSFSGSTVGIFGLTSINSIGIVFLYAGISRPPSLIVFGSTAWIKNSAEL
jgi:hypothetical protein